MWTLLLSAPKQRVTTRPLMNKRSTSLLLPSRGTSLDDHHDGGRISGAENFATCSSIDCWDVLREDGIG